MAGLLDALGSYSGDDTTKDQYGQTQADRRQPLWSGLIKAGLLGVAAGGNLMPADRAKYIAEAGGAIGDIQPQMQAQQTNAMQNLLRQQQLQTSQVEMQGKQADIAQAAQWRAYANSPEFKQAMDSANIPPAQRVGLIAAAMKGDFKTVTEGLDPRRNYAKSLGNGDYQLPNGDIWNQLTGWKMKGGQPVSFNADGSGGGPATPAPTPPDATSPDLNKRTAASDAEIQNWSSTPANAGIPHNLQPSPFDEPRNYAALSNLDPSVARIVQKMGDYDTEPGKAYGRFANPELLKLVEAYNPGFKQNQYKLINDENKEYNTGQIGKSNLAQDTAYAHIGSLWQQYQALNGPDTPTARAVLQEVQRRLGLPSTAGFDVARSAVADEVAKAMRTSGALNEGEQKDWTSKYDPTKSPEQFQRAVAETMTLLEGKETATLNKYKTDTGLARKPYISAQNKALAQYIRANPLGGGKPAATPAVPTPAVPATPTQAEIAAEIARRRQQQQGQ